VVTWHHNFGSWQTEHLDIFLRWHAEELGTAKTGKMDKKWMTVVLWGYERNLPNWHFKMPNCNKHYVEAAEDS